MRRAIVPVAGTCAAIVLAVVLVVQIPAASSMDARSARGDGLRRELVLESGRTSTSEAADAATKQLLATTTARANRLGRRVKREGRAVAGLKKQVASLQKDVKALGG